MTKPIEHGGGLDDARSRYGGALSDWLDLSTGINPDGYCVPPISAHAWQRLPDDGLMQRCLAVARAYYGVPEAASIVAAPGTQAIIQILPQIWASPSVDIVSPTYGEYALCYSAAGSCTLPIGSIEAATSGVVVVGNPNNPDGRLATMAQANAVLASGRNLVVDEAFADVAPAASLVGLAGAKRLMVLKSFGKFFGLAGLRLGFAIGDAETIDMIKAQLGPWAVSGPALEIGAAAMSDHSWITNAQSALAKRRRQLAKLLVQLGFVEVGATDLFVTVSHGRAQQIAAQLAAAHILVRTFHANTDWIRFGLPDTATDFERLENTLKATL